MASAFLALISWTNPVHAEGPKLQVNEAFVYDTNPLMNSDNAVTLYGSETRLLMGYDHQSDRSQFKSGLALTHNELNESVFSTTDAAFNLDMKTTTQRFLLGLRSNFTYDTNRSSEFSSSLFSLNAQRRTSWTVDPTVVYTLAPRTKLSLTASLAEQSYEDDALTDYRTLSLSPAVLYDLTPLQSVSLSLQARRYNSLSGPDRSVDSLGPYLGWKYRFLPQYSFEAFGGFLGSKSSGYGTADDDTWQYNPIYAARLVYTGLQHTASLGISRARQAYAEGTESYLTSIKVDDNVKLSPRWTFDAASSYQFTDKPASSSSQMQSAIDVSAAVTYKGADNWKLSFSPKYRQETYSNNRDDAQRAAFRVGLSYDFSHE